MRSQLIVATVLALTCMGSLCAQDMDKEITGLSDKLSKSLVSKGKKKVATLDFVNLEGRPTELGRFLAEQLSVEFVNAEGISVVDRANIKSILAEHKMTEDGLVKPENAKQLGNFAGVDIILSGTVTPLDDNVMLTVKAISTETAEIVAAGKVSFKKTVEIQQLLNRVASGPATSQGSAAATTANASAIATKDLGNLRVTLQNVQRVKFDLENRKQIDAFQCTFELANRSLQQGIAVSLNRHIDFNNTGFMATLIDFAGNRLLCRELKGVASVGIARKVQYMSIGSSPSVHTEGDVIRFIEAYKRGEPVKAGDDIGWAWEGGSTKIKPSEPIRMMLTFLADNGTSGTSGTIDAELVIVIPSDENGKGEIALHTLTFDNVKLPKAE